MSLTPEETKKVAHLARLEINEQEKISVTKELDKILALIDTMQQVNTSAVEPLAHPFNATQPLRADVITEKNQRELLQKNAPQTTMGLFIVPPVIDSE